MGMFLNSTAPYTAYQEIAADRYFVDKSRLIDELIPAIGTRHRYFNILRPRRFGKTVMANMIAAFFGPTKEHRDLFGQLAISGSKDYHTHLHKHNVIYIDLSRTPENCISYADYMKRLIPALKEDLNAGFASLELDLEKPLWDILQKIFEETGNRFIFVLDEWDAIFHMPFISVEDKKSYLLFLKNLLKDQIYAELVYMTGILPISQYSSGSELNMFVEYDMAISIRFSEFFGFTNEEADRLYEIYQNNSKNPAFSREDLRRWYDGYYNAQGKRLYNPRSVVLALTDGQLRTYWTSSGPYDEVFYYIQNNIAAVQDDLILLAAGEHVAADIGQYTASSMEIKTREQIYSAMVIYGLLTYSDGAIFIPNQELMDRYNKLLLSKESLGYVYSLAKKSEQMVQTTLAGDTKTIEEILQYAHDTESPILSYNNEAELSAVINLCYLAARDKYHVEREDKSGRGFVDFIFYPEKKNQDCIILELKVDSSPQDAIRQIKDKNYSLRFKGKLGEKPKYTGHIIAVGISCCRTAKKHHCKIEILE